MSACCSEYPQCKHETKPKLLSTASHGRAVALAAMMAAAGGAPAIEDFRRVPPLNFGRPFGIKYQKPIDQCSFCKGPIFNETERMPNPTACSKKECRAKWAAERKGK